MGFLLVGGRVIAVGGPLVGGVTVGLVVGRLVGKRGRGVGPVGACVETVGVAVDVVGPAVERVGAREGAVVIGAHCGE